MNLLRRLNTDGRDDIIVVDELNSQLKADNLSGPKFRDFVDKEEFPKWLSDQAKSSKVEAILHQGACTDTLESDEDYMLHNNFEYSKNLLHFAVAKRIPFIYASSASVYGNHDVAYEDRQLESPLNIYARSKLLFDQYVESNLNGIHSSVVGLRYFNVYGVGEAHKGKMASMVHQLYTQLTSSGVGKLFGAAGGFAQGEQRRDFVFVEDLVDVNCFFLRRSPIQTIVNVGSGKSRSWNDLASILISELGTGRIEYMDFPADLEDKYQFDLRADLSKLRSTGYGREFHTLEQGVRKVVAALASKPAGVHS